MIELNSVSKSFNGRMVLKSVSMSIKKGDVAMICGPSGSGKTTLLRTLNRMESIDHGRILINGVDPHSSDCNLAHLRSQVGLVFQHSNLFSHMDVMDNIIMPVVKVKKVKKNVARTKVEHYLEQFGLKDRLKAFPDQLSGGEKQRVAIIRCLALEPSVMLFDEPTSALDWRLREEVAQNIHHLAEKNIAQIIVTHDLDFACEVGNRYFLLDSGNLEEVQCQKLSSCKVQLGRSRFAAHPLGKTNSRPE